jgi:hypothetical protein
MTIVFDAITWATHEAELKTHLGLAGPQPNDAKLQAWLQMATKQADVVIDKDLVDGTGLDIDLDTDLAYSNIKFGVFEFVRLASETNGLPIGIKTGKADHLTKTYAVSSTAAQSVTSITKLVCDYWACFADDPMRL